MMKEFWRRRQEKQWTSSIIAVAIKNWRDLDIKHVCNCNSEVFNESLADSIRGKLIKLSEFESRNPSQCCSTLYIQRSNDRSYGMLLRTCIKNIDKETIHYLWTTCMAKMENMVLEVKTQIQSHWQSENCRSRLLIFKVQVEKDLEEINVSCKLTIDFS